ncbi:hypothetical protein HK405_004740, partial [Cladochytrium tenue]
SKALGIVKGIQDPGYRETAKMLAETTLALVPPVSQTADAAAVFPRLSGGILTGASALGGDLVERLRAAGMTLEAKDFRAEEAHASSSGRRGWWLSLVAAAVASAVVVGLVAV